MACFQTYLFSWNDVEQSSDLERFQKLLAIIDDEKLVLVLKHERGNGRNDYPIEAMINALYARSIFNIPSIADIVRELKRNPALCLACGFDPLRGEAGIPSVDAIERFEKNLVKHQDLLEEIFDKLIDFIKSILPGFGENLAVDSKAIIAYRKKDKDADNGYKDVEEVDENGKPVKFKKTWFGYKLHVICDALYELPIAFIMTKAGASDVKQLTPLLKKIEKRHSDILEKTKYLSADRGYDDGDEKAQLYDDYNITPLIPPRDMGKEKYHPLDPSKSDTIYYSSVGEVCCKTNPFEIEESKQYTPMTFQGYEEDRTALKFRCPAACMGIECKNKEACRGMIKDKGYGRTVRVKLENDRRLFNPAYYHSRTFTDEYKKRTSIERLFYRVDHLYGFEKHTISGEGRIQMHLALSMIAMLATALGFIKEGKVDKIRSRFQAA
jgi:hypothetical protein